MVLLFGPLAFGKTEPTVSCGKLIGAEVRNSKNERLGTVQDLAVDFESARVVAVVLSLDASCLGEEKRIAVPCAALVQENEDYLRFETDRERLNASQSIDGEKWRSNFEPAQVAGMYRNYGVDVYFLDPSRPSGALSPSIERIGHVEKASRLTGFPVRNRQGDLVGWVDDLLVDLISGKVSQVVVLSDGPFADGGSTDVASSEFRYGNSRDELILDAANESLSGTPRIKAIQWLDSAANGEVAIRSFDPYFYIDGTSIPDAAGHMQGTSRADMALTLKICSVLLGESGFSAKARNIQVRTYNGRLTLKGPVESRSEKLALSELAGRYVVLDNVNNQLDVSPSPADR